MTGHNYTLSLDLEAGEKELVFAVTERREFYARLVELEALRGVICPSAQPSEWGVHSMIVTP